MSIKNYSFRLEASSQLNNVFLYLEDDNHMLLTSKDRKVWEGDAELEVKNLLDFRLVVLGRSKISWKGTLKNITDAKNVKQVWADQGKTGENYANKSIREGGINPNGQPIQ